MDSLLHTPKFDGVWRAVGDADLWDSLLAGLCGHPLQSAVWGRARQRADGLESIYLLAESSGEPYVMARVETRELPLLGRVAWIPRGPATKKEIDSDDIDLGRELRRRGFILMITDAYRAAPGSSEVRTIWIDLTLGTEALKKRIDKQWMYGVRRAQREGIEVIRATRAEEVKQFYFMCKQLSQDKGFELPGSEALMQQLLFSPQIEGKQMQLFLAVHEGRIGAGAFVARSGQHLHYFWGASDREMSRQRVGEAVQWAVIEWGVEQGCQRYDLEGIDPINNPGVYAFKKKMGGKEISLVGRRVLPLNFVGRVAALAGRLTGRL